MAYVRISSGQAIFIALLLVSYITEMTGTICNYAELAAYGLADVAHTRQFGAEMRSSNPPWFQEGMQFFAFEHTGRYWEKKDLTWAIIDDPTSMSVDGVGEVITAAFEKWAARSPFTFEEVKHDEQPDIRIRFIRKPGLVSWTSLPQRPVLDDIGVTIMFGDSVNWDNVLCESSWCNFRFAALHEIGHALGLGETDHYRAVMNRNHRRFYQICDPDLYDDDIDGIEELYNDSP